MIESEQLRDAGGSIRHGFFTREGGTSEGLYTSLNCGLGSADDAERVRENRARVTRCLGGGTARLVTVRQVHSPRALVAQEPWGTQTPEADAIVTGTPGLVVGVLSADCAPVLFAEREARVVAAAHAGWRGALQGVIEATVTAMESLGARRDRITAAIGPAIVKDAYQDGPDFQAAFMDDDSANLRFFSNSENEKRPQFDLFRYCLKRLEDAGVANRSSLGLCTYTNESLFFSYRRSLHREEPDYGRQISAIVVS